MTSNTKVSEEESVKRHEEKKWLVCYTAPRAEKKANERLESWGIKTFLPLQKVLKQWSDRKKWVYEPLFRSYLFVHITNDQYMTVLQTPGIVRIVHYLGKPAIVREEQIEYVKRLLKNEVPLETSTKQFKRGDFIRITGGPLTGLEGILQDIQGQKKLIIGLKGIEQSVIATLSPHMVEMIEPARPTVQGDKR